MKIPSVLVDKFKDDHKLNSFVSTSIGRIEGHIKANPLVFFPEYTDHGIAHLEATLQTAVDLATIDAQRIMTSTDAACLSVAIGLHDLGMYLTRDGFESLIAKNSPWTGVSFFDKFSWAALWEDFYSEATRFDDRKLKTLFGENYRPVKHLPASGQPWEEFDFLLVGEFIRRHHARLAHEIAVHGLPATDGKSLLVCPKETSENRFLTDIAGLVARSHGISLRPCAAYLESEYRNRIDPRGTHPIFLGVLLRISDYFQIQASRAPMERTEVTSFKSKFSAGEWKVHQSITDVHNSGEDPEAIVIEATPPNVETYLRIKKWLNGLQDEIDRSWAILGEIFSLQRHVHLDKLGLTIRRVKSNLDDADAFSKSVSYIPEKIAFEAASTDLLKLLVAPLYGEDAGMGIRELVQNAIDAVREFEDIKRHHPALTMLEQYEQAADVLLEIVCDDNRIPIEVVVTDKGVGMTARIVQDYFLRAGASFRKSDVWRQEHEDAEGNSRVLRTGRFGVGALAAFLLGDEIEVTTRHVLSAEGGVFFRARIDDESISVSRISCPVGTKIKIRVPQKLSGRVSQILPYELESSISFASSIGHYFLKNPSLKRTIVNNGPRQLAPSRWLPQPDDTNSVDWRCLSTNEFEKIFWTYSRLYPNISCNGIVISNEGRLHDLSRMLVAPRISAFDRDGYLPVNLQRTDLQSRTLPFSKELLESVTDDLLSYALLEAPDKEEDSWWHGAYPGFDRPQYYLGDDRARWLLLRQTFVPNDIHFLKKLNPGYVLIGIGGQAGYMGWGSDVRKGISDDWLVLSYLPNSLSDRNNRIKGLFESIVSGAQPYWLAYLGLVCAPIQAFVSEPTIDKVKSLKPGQSVREAVAKAERSPRKQKWRQIQMSDDPETANVAKVIMGLKVAEDNPVMFLIAKVKEFRVNQSDDTMFNRWMKNLERPDIPFNLSARKRLKLPTQIKELVQIRRTATRRGAGEVENATEEE